MIPTVKAMDSSFQLVVFMGSGLGAARRPGMTQL
jgi:hypothetical protein